MLIRPFSDLHCERWPDMRYQDTLMDGLITPLPTDHETVAVIAGDMGLAHRQETWQIRLEMLASRFRAIVYVEGNHFFWHNGWLDRIEELKQQVSLPGNVHFLENGTVDIDGVLFVGATLWTGLDKRNPHSMLKARWRMVDYDHIRKPNGRMLKPEDTVDRFEVSRDFIFRALKESTAAKKVVVTHHGISPLSIAERFKGNEINCAFMTDLSADIALNGPDLWVHGHMHNSSDYMLGRTRVIENSYGYMGHEINPHFNRLLVVEV